MSLQSASVARHALVWSFVAQGVCILPLLYFMPYWMPLMWLGVMLWRIQIYRGAWPFPVTKIKLSLAGVCVVALLASYPGIKGVEPLIAFLIVSIVLKVVEMRRRADVLLVIFTGFFAVAAQFLFFQGMLIAIYSIFCCLVLLTAWIAIYGSRILPFKQLLIASSKALAHSLPVMVVLFIVLPRFGSFWQVPLANEAGSTGFSDSMGPGTLSELTKSSSPAFRVNFIADENGNRILPQPKERYWRGLVLDDFDGRQWRYGRTWMMQHGYNSNAVPVNWEVETRSDRRFEYEVLIEPHNQRWLFTLMAPERVASTSLKTQFAGDFLAFSRYPVTSRAKYSVISAPDYTIASEQLGMHDRSRNLRLPEDYNPLTVALAESWVEEGLLENDIIERALQMFQSSFYYTLRPPVLGRHSSDEFLFESKRGFCEHFASSFTILMRAAGIPARVVVGYQGGEYNPLEDYFLIRQSDAHAWAEVWLTGQGWTRVDPTAAVAPSRIEDGLSASLEEEEQSMVSSGFRGSWMSKVQMRIDALSFSWHRWVLGYDAERQKQLLKGMLGGTEFWRIALFALLSTGGMLFVIFLWLVLRNKRAHLSAEARVYRVLLGKLAKRGFKPAQGETPLQFAERVAQAKPQWKSQLVLAVKLLNVILYQGRTDEIPRLRRLIGQMSLD
ncbi:Protein-glutamine gamma-glutamyltransferase [Thalassocella blandensis]|nr:Protein-glutamine gamma-glutamyltransferase [Thalassocella blandensis]